MADLVVWLPRDVIRASGPDTIPFLQGQLSQDVAALAVGETSWSWLLQPQGKVVALLRVTRLGDDDVLLDTDGGFGTGVVGRLERFKLRTKCDLERTKRGPYAGVVGYIDFSGNVDTAIAIRTMVITPDGRASVQAGAGIVADSDPAAEDDECRNKAAALLAAVPAARRMGKTAGDG